MFDALKRRGAGQKPPSQAEELEPLLAEARKERAALMALLEEAKSAGGKFAETTRALGDAYAHAGEVGTRVDDVSRRLKSVETTAASVDAAGLRVAALMATVREAELAVQQILAPGGELQQQRQIAQQLSAHALQARAALDLLASEQETLTRLRADLGGTTEELQAAGKRMTGATSQIEALRAAAAAAANDEARLRDLARESRDEVMAVAGTARELEQKLQRFTELQDAAGRLDERLMAQHALAEHVAQKTKVLENQKRTIEHAIVEAHRLGEMMSVMDSQVSRLNDGNQRAIRVDENVERIDRLVRESTEKLETAIRARDGLAADLVRLDRDRSSLTEFGKKYEERLAGERRALDASQARVAALEGAVARLEQTQAVVGAREQELTAMSDRLSSLASQVETFDARARAVGDKVQALDGVQQDLSRLDEISRRVTWQMESLKTARKDLDEMRMDIQAFYIEHAEASQLRDRLAGDRATLEAFLERMGAFATQLPDLDARMNAIKGKLSIVDEGSQKAANLVAVADDLDRHMTRLVGYQQFVERIDGRLDALAVLTADVDRKLEEQLARRQEADELRSVFDGVSIQATDLRRKLDDVSDVQAKLLPITTQVASLRADVERAHSRLAATLQDQTELGQQETRISGMLESVRTLVGDVSERLSQAQGLTSALSRSEAIKDTLMKELSVVQGRQSEVAGQMDAAEAHLKDIDGVFRKLEQRRDQIAFTEHRIGAFEATANELTAQCETVERRLRDLAAQNEMLAAVRRDVEGVHSASADSKADLAYLEAHRSEVVALRAQLDEVLAMARSTEERLSEIQARKRMVDEVQLKVNVITGMLADVRVNLETVGEQKAVLDHVLEGLATLSERVSEAQSTLRSLQAERELAERIAAGIKSLRSRTTITDDRKRA